MNRYLPLAPMTILTLSSAFCVEAGAGSTDVSLAPETNKVQRNDNENKNVKKRSEGSVAVASLSEDFLMFLAEMEESDGELIHPVDFVENESMKVTKVKRTTSDESDDK